jgi:hypothetical protein
MSGIVTELPVYAGISDTALKRAIGHVGGTHDR